MDKEDEMSKESSGQINGQEEKTNPDNEREDWLRKQTEDISKSMGTSYGLLLGQYNEKWWAYEEL